MAGSNADNKFYKGLLAVQSIYFFITGIWPLADITSFMVVTGPKHDVWLVKTVGAMLIPVSLCLGTYIFVASDRRPAMVLGLCSAVAFGTIDFYYSLTDVISDIYMADGVVQTLLITAWVYVIVRK